MEMTVCRPALRVLIADDSVTIREHLTDLLAGLDAVQVVGEAGDVGGTLASVRALQPEVVVLDIQMPGGNGIKALRHIKRDFPETRVIMLTNHADSFYRETCMREGADYFLDKTIECEKVLDILDGMRPTNGS